MVSLCRVEPSPYLYTNVIASTVYRNNLVIQSTETLLPVVLKIKRRTNKQLKLGMIARKWQRNHDAAVVKVDVL